MWSLGPALVADRFGEHRFASIYALTSASTALASYLFSAVMAARLYEQQIDDDAAAARTAGTAAGVNVCIGSDCFKWAYLILAICNAGGVLAGVILTAKLAPLYRGGPNCAPLRYDGFIQYYGVDPLPQWVQRRWEASRCADATRANKATTVATGSSWNHADFDASQPLYQQLAPAG